MRRRGSLKLSPLTGELRASGRFSLEKTEICSPRYHPMRAYHRQREAISAKFLLPDAENGSKLFRG